MGASAGREFDSVSTREEWGIADAMGFHLHDSAIDARRHEASGTFTVCRIDGRQVAADGADLETCAFATACVAINHGLFAVPASYAIRFEGRFTVRVSMDFDADSASWFGEAAVDS